MHERLASAFEEIQAAPERWRERCAIIALVVALVVIVIVNPIGLAAQAALPAAFVLVALFVASCIRADEFSEE